MSTKLGKIVADFTTSLASAIAIGGTTATLQSATDDDGVAMPDGLYYFAIDGGNSLKEFIQCTKTGVNLTAIQSVSRQGVLTAGCVRAHRVGASVALTDFAYILYMQNMLLGSETLDSSSPMKYDNTFSPTLGQYHVPTWDFVKNYVDTGILSGAADASTATKGIGRVTVAPDKSLGTVTMTIASPCVVSLTAHGLTLNDMVKFTTTGALPTGLVAGTTYYVIAAGLTADAFQVSASQGGSAINTTGGQSGVHTLWRMTPFFVGDNDGRVPTQAENDALVGTSGTAVSSSNKLIDNADTTGTGLIIRTTGLDNIAGIFGDGSDGTVDITSGAFSSGPITSNALTRDAYFNNLTLSGGNLDMAGYRLFVKGTLTIASTFKLTRNGVAASAGTGGTALSAGTLPGSSAGGNAGARTSSGGGGPFNANAGTSGSAAINCLGPAAPVSGAGGSGSVGSDGAAGTTAAAGTAGSRTAAKTLPRSVTQAISMLDLAIGAVGVYTNSPSSGGGSSGSSSGIGGPSANVVTYGGRGGGAGSSAGVFCVSAANIVLTGTGNWLEAIGGAGAAGEAGQTAGNQVGPTDYDGSGGGGGGGAGGNGGNGVLIYRTKTGSRAVDLSGGAAGTGGAGGAAGTYAAAGTAGATGTAGTTGTLYEFDLA